MMVAFLLGAITGGAVALLLAPEKGEVTRGKIRQGATDLYGKGKDLIDRGRSNLSEKVGGVKEGARQQLDAVKEAISEGKEVYRREMEKS